MGLLNAFRKVSKAAVQYVLLPTMLVACAGGMMAMKQAEPVNDNPREKVETKNETQQSRIVNETFLLKRLEINYQTRGLGSLSLRAEGTSGAKNTGTGAFRTDLSLGIVSTPFGAAENINGTNNAIVFTKIDRDYKGNPQDNNNRGAYVEFYIQPASDIRESVQRTNSSSFTVDPYFSPVIPEDVDLDSADVKQLGPYGVHTLKFKGYVQDLVITSDLGGTQQGVANSLVNLSSNGLLITGFNANRVVYDNTNRATGGYERMTPTPKNVFK